MKVQNLITTLFFIFGPVAVFGQEPSLQMIFATIDRSSDSKSVAEAAKSSVSANSQAREQLISRTALSGSYETTADDANLGEWSSELSARFMLGGGKEKSPLIGQAESKKFETEVRLSFLKRKILASGIFLRCVSTARNSKVFAAKVGDVTALVRQVEQAANIGTVSTLELQSLRLTLTKLKQELAISRKVFEQSVEQLNEGYGFSFAKDLDKFSKANVSISSNLNESDSSLEVAALKNSADLEEASALFAADRFEIETAVGVRRSLAENKNFYTFSVTVPLATTSINRSAVLAKQHEANFLRSQAKMLASDFATQTRGLEYELKLSRMRLENQEKIISQYGKMLTQLQRSVNSGLTSAFGIADLVGSVLEAELEYILISEEIAKKKISLAANKGAL